MALQRYEEEFSQLLKLQEQVEQLECQEKSQKEIYLQIWGLKRRINQAVLDVAQAGKKNLKHQHEKLIFDAMVLQRERYETFFVAKNNLMEKASAVVSQVYT
ncbi:hypothetical protein JRQ81_015691 [Phrynocephalus forsythii]|uniref:Uncharacterized protein n=1 Tax=Phrynocephalus forsythii TaxID=171643 RepID=A0A9Q0XX26_9SAUR|nr:hypothetical protein JRQ81_015691 [Phrynocephalus forsythii]